MTQAFHARVIEWLLLQANISTFAFFKKRGDEGVRANFQTAKLVRRIQ